MGTRSITNIYDGDDLLVTIYRQFDGYPTGQGRDIKAALGGRKFVNGIPGGANTMAVVNGMGCAAALPIAFLKSGLEAGNVYIDAPNPDAAEKYLYTLRGNPLKLELGIQLVVQGYSGSMLYSGALEDFEGVEAGLEA